MVKIYYVYGKTGTGKTWFIYEFLKRYGSKYHGKEISWFDNKYVYEIRVGCRYTGQPIVFIDNIHLRKQKFDSQIYNKTLVNPNTIFIFTSLYPIEKYKWLKNLGNKLELKTIHLEKNDPVEIKKDLDKILDKIISII